MSSLITSVAWTPRGSALPQPRKYALTDEELQRVSKLASVQLDEAKMQLEAAQQMEGEQDARDMGAEEDENAEGNWEE